MKGWLLVVLIGVLGWLGWEKVQGIFDLSSKIERRKEQAGEDLDEENIGTVIAEPAKVEIGPTGVLDHARVVETASPPLANPGPGLSIESEPLPPLKLVRYQVGNTLDESQVTFLRSLAVDRRRNKAQGELQILTYDATRGLLLALVEEDRVDDWLAAVEGMDVRPRQVGVEAVLTLATLSSGKEFGVRWLAGWLEDGGPLLKTGTVSLGGGSLAIQSGPFEFALRRAVSEGSAVVLSRPSIGVVLGREAKIESGRQVPVRQVDNLQGNAVSKVDFRDVSLSLAVTVSATTSGYLVQVTQRNDDVIGEVNLGDGNAPEIATQSVETAIELPPGHWVAAGSVVVDRSSASRLGIFADFPGQRSGVDHRAEIGLFIRVLDGVEVVGPPAVVPAPVVRDQVGAESPRRQAVEPVQAEPAYSPALPSVEVRPAKKKLLPFSK